MTYVVGVLNLKWIEIRHYNDVIMSAMVSQITSLMIIYSTVYSGTDQRKHQSSVSLAFVRGIHQWPVNSLHKRPVTQEMFPFDDVIMKRENILYGKQSSLILTRCYPIYLKVGIEEIIKIGICNCAETHIHLKSSKIPKYHHNKYEMAVKKIAIWGRQSPQLVKTRKEPQSPSSKKNCEKLDTIFVWNTVQWQW